MKLRASKNHDWVEYDDEDFLESYLKSCDDFKDVNGFEPGDRELIYWLTLVDAEKYDAKT